MKPIQMRRARWLHLLLGWRNLVLAIALSVVVPVAVASASWVIHLGPEKGDTASASTSTTTVP